MAFIECCASCPADEPGVLSAGPEVARDWGGTVSGTKSQTIGDWGEKQVMAILASSDVQSEPFGNDPGEDLLVEVDQREATATGALPQQAYLQVKARRRRQKGDYAGISVPRARLERWASHQIPVFLVLITGKGTPTPTVYLRSVDEFIQKSAPGEDPSRLAEGKHSVRLARVDQLVPELRKHVGQFYRETLPGLEGLAPREVRESYLEVLDAFKLQAHSGLTGQPVLFRVLWKGPRRPAYLAACVRWLIRDCLGTPAEDADFVGGVFHLHRSYFGKEFQTPDVVISYSRGLTNAWPFPSARLSLRRIESRGRYHDQLLASSLLPEEYVPLVLELGGLLDSAASEILAHTAIGSVFDWTDALESTRARIVDLMNGPFRIPLGGHRWVDLAVFGYLEAISRFRGSGVEAANVGEKMLSELRDFHGCIRILVRSIEQERITPALNGWNEWQRHVT